MWVCSCACVRLCVRLCVGEIFRNTLSESIWKKIFIILGYLKMSEEKNYASRAASNIFFCKTIISSFLSCSWEDMCFPNLSFQFSSVLKFYWKSSQIKSDNKIHQPGFLPSEIYYIHLNKITRSPRTSFQDKLVKTQTSSFIINNFTFTRLSLFS